MEYTELKAELNRLMKYGTKCRLYPTEDSKEWDQAYGAGIVSAAESIIRIINQMEVEAMVRSENNE